MRNRPIDPAELPGKRARDRALVARRRPATGAGTGHSPVGEATYRRVRADIVYGRLPPGQATH